MPGDLKPPIFLLGNVRSGTSMMHDLFDMHPEVKSWYEPRTIWTYADPARRHDRFDENDATPRVIRYIRGRFLKYQRQHGDARIMEKTPSNLLRIPYVNAIFPEARYLYLVREPLANISSSELMWTQPIHRHKVWRRLKETPKTQLYYYAARYVVDHARVRLLRKRYLSVWGVRYPGVYRDIKRMRVEEVIARQWVACSRQARADLASLDPGVVLHMRYEDFVAAPVEQFERILRHFDLDMTPEIERALRERIDPNRQQKWKRLDPDAIGAALPILSEEMRRHGYEVPEDYRHLATGDR
jgi:hypothetical protein